MAIFVHGAGYLQNMINGWNNYYREFMFNDLLTRKGYVVLDIDYRGSAGYGRDWRTDVYDFLGGKDFDDHIDAIDHMVKNYGVDQKRIGAYGGSYGGFMAGMLVFAGSGTDRGGRGSTAGYGLEELLRGESRLHGPAAGLPGQESGSVQTQLADHLRRKAGKAASYPSWNGR